MNRDYSHEVDRIDRIGLRELDRPVADQATSAGRLLVAAVFAAVLAVLAGVAIAASLSAQTATAAASPHMAVIMAAGGGGATGAVGTLSTIGGVVYLTVAVANFGHIAWVRIHKGRAEGRAAAAEYLEGERHGR